MYLRVLSSLSAVSGLFCSSLERQRDKTRRNGERDETESEGGWQGVRESAVSAKRVGFMFGAKPAQSETPVRAAAERRPPGRGRSRKGRHRLRRIAGWGCCLLGGTHEAHEQATRLKNADCCN